MQTCGSLPLALIIFLWHCHYHALRASRRHLPTDRNSQQTIWPFIDTGADTSQGAALMLSQTEYEVHTPYIVYVCVQRLLTMHYI